MLDYPIVGNGEGIELAPHPEIEGAFELLNLMCCDCKLVHRIAFAVEANGNLGIALERNVEATEQAKRQ